MWTRQHLAEGLGMVALFVGAAVLGDAAYTYAPCDGAIDFLVLDGRVVVHERMGWGRDTLPVDRLTLRDASTGAPLRLVRADERELLAFAGGRVWLRADRGVEARDPGTLAVARPWTELRRAQPDLAALEEVPLTASWSAEDRALRFTAADGRHLQFQLDGEEVTDATPEPSTRHATVDVIPWPTGGEIRRGPVVRSEREVVLGPTGAPTPVSGLDLTFLDLPIEEGTVWVLLREAWTDEAPATLVRLDPVTGAVRWRAPLPGATHTTFTRAARAGGVVLLGDGARVYAVDAATGEVRWQRGPGDLGDLIGI
jgi:hypothetical protein